MLGWRMRGAFRRHEILASGLLPLAFALFTSAVHAADVSYIIQQAETGFFAGGGVLYQHYTEVGSSGAALDTETGSIPAFTVGVSGMTTNPRGGFYWRAAYTRANGSTNYSGHYVSGAPAQTTTTNTISEFRGRLGDAFGIGRALGVPTAIIPYLGLGFHHWTRNVGNGSGLGGIEQYADSHIGIGLLGDVAVSRHWVLGIHLLEGYTFGAQLQATLPMVVDTSTNQEYSVAGTHALGDRPYWDVGLKAVYLIDPVWRVYLHVRRTTFHYGASSPTPIFDQNGVFTGYYTQEPNSSTVQTLTTIGVAARF